VDEARELRQRLEALTLDVRTLDPAGFRRWLDLHLARWTNDPVFVQRSRIRDIRRGNAELRRLEAEYARVLRADAESEYGPRLAGIERELHDVGRAIAGLTEALAHAELDRKPSLRAKRQAFAAR
jgi:hypothetical protein